MMRRGQKSKGEVVEMYVLNLTFAVYNFIGKKKASEVEAYLVRPTLL